MEPSTTSSGVGRWSPIAKVSDVLETGTRVVLVIATVAFSVLLAVSVFYRYVLNNSVTWSDEVALIFFVWATFLGIASGYRHGKHINITFLVDRLSTSGRDRIDWFRETCELGFIVSFLVSSVQNISLMDKAQTAALGLPLLLSFMALPVSAALMLAHWVVSAKGYRTVGRSVSGLALVAVMIAILTNPYGRYIEFSGGALTLGLVFAFLIPLAVGVPVAFCLGLLGFLYGASFADLPLSHGSLETYFGINQVPYLAIPLLIAGGMIMEKIGIAEDLIRLVQVFFGRLRGGLGMVDVGASALFADISGSAVADTAAMGSILIPKMKDRGYGSEFTAALQAAAGTLGLMFPPAITLLLYATVTNVSVSQLFAASVIPGVIVALSFMFIVAVRARKFDLPAERTASKDVLAHLLHGIPGVLAAVLVVGGIVGGIITPAEAGVVLVAYVLLLSVTAYRGTPAKRIFDATIEAIHTSSMVLFLAAVSAFVGFNLARNDIPQRLVEGIGSVSLNRYFVLLVLNVAFILLGTLLEPPAIIVAFLPASLPLLAAAHIDPVHWGVLFVVNAGIGLLHPPVGLNLAVSSKLAGTTFERAFRASIPFILIMIADLIILSVFPFITLSLPKVLGM